MLFETIMNLVSVVIPTYNRADTVGYAINSALNQTYTDIEILVIDDGSTDQTAQIISQFGSRIKYFYKDNGGVSSARNLGIRKSTGEMIAFLDSDDEWLPNKIERQLRFMHENPDFGMVLCDCNFINSKRHITGKSSRRKDLPHDGFILEDVLLSPSLLPSSVLIKKSILIDIGGFDETLKTAEDLDLHLKIANNYKISLRTEPLFNYMRGNAGLSELSCTYDDNVLVIKRFTDMYRNKISFTTTNKALFKTYIAAATGKFWLKEWLNGTKYTLMASRHVTRPGNFFLIARMFFFLIERMLLKSLKCINKLI